MSESILEAIVSGKWDFEPESVDEAEFDNTRAVPGSPEKLNVMAERIRTGLPIWHSDDRVSYGETE